MKVLPISAFYTEPVLVAIDGNVKIINYDKNNESLKELADILFNNLPGMNMREFVNSIIARYNKAGWTNEEIRDTFKLN